MNKEEREMFNELSKKMDALIEEVLEKYQYDSSFFEFIVKCDLLNERFHKVQEHIVLDTREQSFCTFCKSPTDYYYKENDMFICARCLKNYEGGE